MDAETRTVQGRGLRMSRVDQLLDIVDTANKKEYSRDEWMLTVLVDIAMSLATIADALTEKGDNDDTD